MPEPLQLRTAAPPETIVVIRLGERTLEDSKLVDLSRAADARSMGLTRLLGLRGAQRRLSIARSAGADCHGAPASLRKRAAPLSSRAGFPLFPTADHPHWTVVLSEPTPAQFGRVRALFDGPKQNPAWSGRTGS